MIDIDFSLGATVDLEARFRDWTSTDAVQRLWDKDTTLWREDPTRRLDTFASGPDHSISEAVRRRFFGEK